VPCSVLSIWKLRPESQTSQNFLQNETKSKSSFIFGRVMGIEVVLLKKWILGKMHLKFWNVHFLRQLPSWFLAGNIWKWYILLWNQLYLKEEGLYYAFRSKSHFSHFWLFPLFWAIAYLSFCNWQYGTFLYGRTHIEIIDYCED